jgi:hypothetical protein
MVIRLIGIVVLVGGAVLLLLSVFADLVGIGIGGFGIRQTVGLIAGIIGVALGVILILIRRKS